MSAATSSHRASSQVAGESVELCLQCPRCASFLGQLRTDDPPHEFLFSCTNCYFQLQNAGGIWDALPSARATHFERFLREYQVVREAEGRGSEQRDYYLALPYRDLSGYNQSQWRIRSLTYRHLERKILPSIEAANHHGLRILDLGAGNCWMTYRLALRQHWPVAVDLLTSATDGLGAAVHYKQTLAKLFPRFQAELSRLPFSASQFDVAIFNASFHYSEDYCAALGEAIRCVRPGGFVIVADTAWYRNEESGQQMVAERQKAFIKRYGFPSDGIASLEYLTDRRLSELEDRLGVRWKIYSPFYGLRWAMRPLIAKLKGKREPSRFRIYVAEVTK